MPLPLLFPCTVAWNMKTMRHPKHITETRYAYSSLLVTCCMKHIIQQYCITHIYRQWSRGNSIFGSVHLSVHLDLRDLRCAPPRGYRTTFCTTDLHCAPLNCVVHHWPVLCTILYKGDTFSIDIKVKVKGQRSRSNSEVKVKVRGHGQIFGMEWAILGTPYERSF